jgi:hypothetical protein
VLPKQGRPPRKCRSEELDIPAGPG